MAENWKEDEKNRTHRWLMKHQVIMPPSGKLCWVHGPIFGVCSTLLISLNAVYNGIQSDMAVRAKIAMSEPSIPDTFWNRVEFVFMLLFTIELALRFIAGPKFFIIGCERLWNMFDAIVVVGALVEWVLAEAGSGGSSGIMALRTLRLVRILRVLRVAKDIPMIRNLRTIVFSLTNSVQSFVPAMLLLLMIIYVFGLSF